jgi:hypothetical protein
MYALQGRENGGFVNDITVLAEEDNPDLVYIHSGHNSFPALKGNQAPPTPA